MRFLPSLALGTLLLTSPLAAQDFNFNKGNFTMQFNVEESYYANDHKDILDAPICYAISNQKRLDLVIETREQMGPKEFKIVTKRLVIEPHAYGVTQNGKPILKGNIASQKLIKEVAIKFGDDPKGDSNRWSEKEGAFFSGSIKSDKSQNIDIRKISNVYVISDSHFDVPKDYKGVKDESIRVVCELPKRE